MRGACQNRLMFLTIPTVMTWTRIVAIPLIVGVFYLNIPSAERNLIATVEGISRELAEEIYRALR